MVKGETGALLLSCCCCGFSAADDDAALILQHFTDADVAAVFRMCRY